MQTRIDNARWLRIALPTLLVSALAVSGCKPPLAPQETDAATESPAVMDDDTASPDASASASDGVGDKAKTVVDRIGGAVSSTAAGLTAQSYVEKALTGDLFEIESSKIIAGKTSDPAVRQFAQMMIQAHQHSTAKVREAAGQSGITITPPMLSDGMRKQIDKIRAASGEQADLVYLKAQRDAHADALTLHRTYARMGGDGPLRAAAAAIAPEVQKHIDMLHKLHDDGARGG